MNLKTNVRALCEEIFFSLGNIVDSVEKSEQIALKLVELNLTSEKRVYITRLQNNKELIEHIHKQKKYDEIDDAYQLGSICSIEAINKTCEVEIKQIDDKLYDLQILKLTKWV